MLKKLYMKNSDKTKALVQLMILLCLWLWAFHSELFYIIISGAKSSERSHALVTPFAVALLIYLRRDCLVNCTLKGTIWGLVVILGGMTVYAATIWPFGYGNARQVSIVIILARIVLVTCGWRTLQLCFPMLLLALIAVPIGAGLYTRLIIRPETYTIAASSVILGSLPGVETIVKGTDVLFSSAKNSGVIGLGESYRGVRLLQTFMMIGTFVVFSQPRTFWRLFWAALISLPIIFFCNLLRLLCWGLVTIYVDADPLSTLPRSISAAFSLFITYLLFVLICSVKLNLFVEIE
jgi:exosortase